MESAVYEGWVRHRRYTPHAHTFRYKLALFYLDLEELDQVFDGRWHWTLDRPSLAAFRRADYLGDADEPLLEAVRRRVREATGHVLTGPVRLLTHARYFGHCFNPVSFYYCYEPDGVTLDTVLAEITNTPWRERHAYALPLVAGERHGSAVHFGFDKAFHVSPFLPMDMHYRWAFQAPGESIRVHMDVLRDEASVFDATLNLERHELTPATRRRCLLRFPPMTLKVVAAIHWQALRLWLKGNPVHDHPKHSSATPP